MSSTCIIISGSEGPRWQRGHREGWHDRTENAREKAKSDLCAPLSEFTVEDRESYGVQLYAHVQHRGFPSENFLFWLPPTFPPCAHRGRSFMSFYSPFPLKPLHPRAIYESGERHAPARFIPRPVEWAQHRFIYGISRSTRFNSDPPRIRDVYDTSILSEKTRFGGKNQSILHKTHVR